MTFIDFTTRHPYRSAFFFLLVVVTVVIVLGVTSIFLSVPGLEQLTIEETVLIAVGIFLLTRLGWWKRAGYLTGIRLAHIPLLILPCVIALFSLGEGIKVTEPVMLLAFAGLTLMVGFAEETFFRGLIFTTLIPTGTMRAVFLSSFLFAAPHLLNILGGTWDPTFTVIDSFAAFGLGISFAAIRLRTGSIWPLVGIHGLFDFCSLVSLGSIIVPAQSLQSLVTSVIVGFVFIAYGLFLIRKEIKRNPDSPVPEVHQVPAE